MSDRDTHDDAVAPIDEPHDREPVGSDQDVSDPRDETTAPDFVVMGQADPILASAGPEVQTPSGALDGTDRGDGDVSTDPIDPEPVADPDLDPDRRP